MSKLGTEHAEAREFWIENKSFKDGQVPFEAMRLVRPVIETCYIRVREVRPGEITLTREELRAAYQQAVDIFGDLCSDIKLIDILCEQLELLPEGTGAL